jgi:hypothetical protein
MFLDQFIKCQWTGKNLSCVLWGREKGWSVRADSEFVFVIDLWTTKGEVDVTF